MITCTRKIEFCAGHRVFGHEGKCRNLHGHNYVALVRAVFADELDDLGRVVDFSVLKEKVGGWIDQNWDHGFLLWQRDSEAQDAVTRLAGTKLFLMRDNPTAENIAAYLLEVACPHVLSGTGVTVIEVTVWETPNCYATAKAKNELPSQ